jgi:hypothetical protein
MKIDLSGTWRIELSDGTIKEDGFLPGTLDENRLGKPDKIAGAWHPDMENRETEIDKLLSADSRIATRLTRNYTYEGAAKFTRIFHGEIKKNKRYFLFAERARAMSLKIDGKSAPVVESWEGGHSYYEGLSTPCIFEITGLIRDGSIIEITTDNTYPGLPYKDITCSSAATDETQTNWNGVVGQLYIEEKSEAFIEDFRVYPDLQDFDSVFGEAVLSYKSLSKGQSRKTSGNQADKIVRLVISGECLEGSGADLFSREVTIYADANNSFHFSKVAIKKEFSQKKWDEGEGNLLYATARLYEGDDLLDEKKVSFGIREFTYDGSGRLTLNGRRIFLRSEANCGLFPETGHPPMDRDSWLDIMKTYASYGVNCVRFHSWCPPEAAFSAADELGMLVQPELPNWNPRDAFSTKECRDFYENELRQIIKTYANHPSFAMLTLGNELHTDDDGISEMHRLIEIAKKMDSTRLFAWGSNNFYGEKGTDKESDFYTSSNVGASVLRLAVSGNEGRINTEVPNSTRNFDDSMEVLRKNFKKPVFSFEVGQYEVLPDMHELDEFKGVTRPDNFYIVRDRIEKSGMEYEEYEKRVEATGELALLAYREEVEAVLRTREMSGISLLGLQDFTGQGTALVGMMNSHLKPKSYSFASPERYNEFFAPQVVLVLLDKYVYKVGETIRAEVRVANFGKEPLPGGFGYELCVNENSNHGTRLDGGLYTLGSKKGVSECPVGEVTSLGNVEIPLDNIEDPTRFDLIIRLARFSERLGVCAKTDIKATYPIWVYPDLVPECPKGVYETRVLDKKAIDVLKNGGKVFFDPHSTKEAIPNSVKAQFSTDFWSVGTFPNQEGAMGQFIDKEHPVFDFFPTEEHSNFQWFRMASQRAFILPRYMKSIVAEMDCYVRLRPMAQLLEVKAYNGKMIMSSMGLHDLLEHPEARALLSSIYRYMDSDVFEPEEVISEEELGKIIAMNF